MNALDAVYSLTIGPHYYWHRYVTGKYGPHVEEKTGAIPDRLKTSATAVMGVDNLSIEPPCLWVHSVSVGETVASRDLVRMFAAENPRWEIRVSTTTATGRSIAEKYYGASNVFYYPLDFSQMVHRTFSKVRPSLIVLMELEIWPNFLAEAARRRIPVVVANARITERSVRRLSLVPSVARNMARVVEAWFAQTQTYAERLERIGVPSNRIEVTGSVKYDAVPLDLDEVTAAEYRRLFGCSILPFHQGGDLVVVAGSTHPGEEVTLLEALRDLPLPEGRRRRVILTPRHPERLDEVEREASRFGTVTRRSTLPEPSPDGKETADGCKKAETVDIILVDTMGELSKIYAAADVVFVGGTLIRHGGQNFIEPCGLAKPTIVGPHLWNFSEPAELLASCDGMVTVPDAAALRLALERMIAAPGEAALMGQRARAELVKQRGAARRMADRLNVLAKCIGRW